MCLIIKGGNYLGIKRIILAIESTYFKFIIREINNQYFLELRKNLITTKQWQNKIERSKSKKICNLSVSITLDFKKYLYFHNDNIHRLVQLETNLRIPSYTRQYQYFDLSVCIWILKRRKSIFVCLQNVTKQTTLTTKI